MSSLSGMHGAVASLADVGFIVLMGAAAISDARTLRIPNAIPLAMALLFAVAFQFGLYHPLIVHLESFALCAVVGAASFYAGVWGGGDAKLLAAVGLFLAPRDLLSLALVIALAGGVVTLIVLLERAVRGRKAANAAVPYGIAIAAGGLTWCFTAG